MKREALTKKLERIVHTIQSGNTPTPVRNLWVYGSYARGALNCGDLDLAIVYDYPSKKLIEEKAGLLPWPLGLRRFEHLIRDSLVKRGERIEIVMHSSEEDLLLLFFKRVPISDAILVWSEEHTNWEETISSIKPNPNAGRFDRPYPINLKRTGTSRSVMEEVLFLVEQQRLNMQTVDMNSIQLRLTIPQKTNLARWRSLGRGCGRDTLKILPYAYDWLNREKQHFPEFSFLMTKIISDSETHLVHLGKIDFFYVRRWMYNQAKARKLCLIPHLQKKSKNPLFVFTRGSRWTGKLDEDLRLGLKYM